ncbi:MAG TPA: outer membrane lipoprotein-sorting protein [Solimonas sp.]|nr:outer membrane lipoprotein-sorting protein [Solimonas sp.]
MILTRLLLAASLFGSGAAAARSEAELRACMAANLPQHTLAQDLILTRRGADPDTRPMALRWYWRRRSGDSGFDAAMRLSAPADLAGAAYLFIGESHADGIYVYLPALGKVRRVNGATAAASLFGSNLSVFDLKLLTSGLRGGRLQRLGDTVSDGHAAERWRYLPPDDPDILYDRIDLVIDDAWCLPLVARLYGGVPWKVLTLDRATVQQNEGRWQARRATLSDLRDGSRTLIEIRDQRIDDAIPDAVFSPRRFYK